VRRNTLETGWRDVFMKSMLRQYLCSVKYFVLVINCGRASIVDPNRPETMKRLPPLGWVVADVETGPNQQPRNIAGSGTRSRRGDGNGPKSRSVDPCAIRPSVAPGFAGHRQTQEVLRAPSMTYGHLPRPAKSSPATVVVEKGSRFRACPFLL
jgi:hypothetical protein